MCAGHLFASKGLFPNFLHLTQVPMRLSRRASVKGHLCPLALARPMGTLAGDRLPRGKAPLIIFSLLKPRAPAKRPSLQGLSASSLGTGNHSLLLMTSCY